MPHVDSPPYRITALALAMFAASAGAEEVRVYTDQTITLSHVPHAPTATVIYLDAAQRLEDSLSSGLPANPAQAQPLVRQRLKQGGEALEGDLVQAWQGVTDAWGLGIVSLPAVVVDRRYVIYGEADVAKAVSRIKAYRKARP